MRTAMLHVLAWRVADIVAKHPETAVHLNPGRELDRRVMVILLRFDLPPDVRDQLAKNPYLMERML